jgi:hypothetical protein
MPPPVIVTCLFRRQKAGSARDALCLPSGGSPTQSSSSHDMP